MYHKQLSELIGRVPEKSNSFIKRMRFHQGWWRAFVLNLPQGEYVNMITKEPDFVCNRINGGEMSKVNFITQEAHLAAGKTILGRTEAGKGLIEQERLFNNLLSSQPLAFNFFGLLSYRKSLCKRFIQGFVPEVQEVVDVVFEHAPETSKDNSAFDVGFIVKTDSKKGFIGFECKYTDPFSFKNAKNVIYGGPGSERRSYYEDVYLKSRDRFLAGYDDYVMNKDFNQLFRNEILACHLEKEHDFVYTGIFCHQDDLSTLDAGTKFQKMVAPGTFIVMTYFDFIERIQKLELSREEREWTIKLWCRYSGDLSENSYRNCNT